MEARGIQRANQIGEARRAGLILTHIARQTGTFAAGTRISGRIGRIVEIDEIFRAPRCASAAKTLRQLDIGHVFRGKPHQRACVCIYLNGIRAQKHTVGLYGRSAFFKNEVAAEAVYNA